jgi:hypothetical protein
MRSAYERRISIEGIGPSCGTGSEGVAPVFGLARSARRGRRRVAGAGRLAFVPRVDTLEVRTLLTLSPTSAALAFPGILVSVGFSDRKTN